jgi:CRISPR associated protein Cas1
LQIIDRPCELAESARLDGIFSIFETSDGALGSSGLARELDGQQQLVRNKLANATAADIIAKLQESLSSAESLDTVARLEAHAASAYWSAWSELPINFPRQDINRVPEHWRTFGTRKSAITGSPRLATNPPNAILNYCYALLECEARLAAAAVGLDPGMGMLHVDTANRDSLACDIMEAVRPSLDAWLLDWIMREPFRRSDFFEQSNGNCRLLRSLTVNLSETMSVWGKLVAPWAEYVARTLWAGAKSGRTHNSVPRTRLTQQRRTEAKGKVWTSTIKSPKNDHVCRGCGKTIPNGSTHCADCAVDSATERLIGVASQGRMAARTPEARAKHGATRRRHAKACKGMLGMGRIEAAKVAYRSGVHRENSTPARANVSFSYRIADWGVTLVRRTDSRRLPSSF